MALLTTATQAFAATNAQPVIAVLPLAPAAPTMPYELFASPSELSIMTGQLRKGLGTHGVALVGQGKVAPAVSAAGFIQATPIRACVLAECAQKIGRMVHADQVVIGSVTRLEAVWWETNFSIIDVRTGKVLSTMDFDYKGDVRAVEVGGQSAGACIARVIKGQKPCPPDRAF